MKSHNRFATERADMVRTQLERRGIKSSRVLAAMRRLPREMFVSDDCESLAYADQALPIECGQTISQPYIVALMTESLEFDGTQHVLEIGTGSAYQTAILAELAGDVISIERCEELSKSAQAVLNQLGYRNIKLIVGDGSQGYPSEAPYDRIIITAAADQCPPQLLSQLADNGILVGPFGPASGQMLQSIRKLGDRLQTVNLVPCRFVPLLSDES